MTFDFAIPYSMGAVITGGQTMSVSGEISVGAHEEFRATAVKSGGTAELDLTAEAIATITFVSMKADNYENLAFQVGEGTPVVFDGPIMLVGAGQVALLGAALAAITFTNSDTEADANIEVCIGRSGEVAT